MKKFAYHQELNGNIVLVSGENLIFLKEISEDDVILYTKFVNMNDIQDLLDGSQKTIYGKSMIISVEFEN